MKRTIVGLAVLGTLAWAPVAAGSTDKADTGAETATAAISSTAPATHPDGPVFRASRHPGAVYDARNRKWSVAEWRLTDEGDTALDSDGRPLAFWRGKVCGSKSWTRVTACER